MSALIEAIKKAKENRQIKDDCELARIIGISNATLCRVLKSERNVGPKVLSKIMVNLPELSKEVSAYLKERGSR